MTKLKRGLAIGSMYTFREISIIDCLLEGKTNAEIGESLNLKERSVKNYLNHIFKKAGVKNRTALVARELRKRIESGNDLKHSEPTGI